MHKRIVKNGILSVIMLTVIAGCVPSRIYTEGILAKDYRFMSIEDLQRYEAQLSEEIAQVGQTGSVPVGVTREQYVMDLKLRREAVQDEIRSRILWEDDKKFKEQFQKWPSS
jgi:hypothetical protein